LNEATVTTTPDAPSGSELPPPDPRSRYDRFRGEVMAGGSVTERPAEAPGGGVQGAIAGASIIALLVWLAVANMWMFVFVVGILVSVFLHETGHFVTARRTGMKATQFFIGFGPRIWSFHRGETEYGVRMLPLGAFVRIIGMNNLDDVPREDEGRTYRQQTFPRRLLVISAGSIMHMLIAVVLFFAVFAVKGQMVDAPGAEISQVAAGTPAAAAGLEAGDVITAVGGETIDDAANIGAVVRTFDPGDQVVVEYTRDGTPGSVEVTLGENPGTDVAENRGAAYLGVSSRGVVVWEEMSIPSAAANSVTDLFPLTWQSTQGVVKVLNPVNIWEHVTNTSDDPTSRPTTLVGATDVSGSIGDSMGLGGVIYLLAALNVFVGVFNMFPLLPLDGGHAAIAIYERVQERRLGIRRYFTDVSRLMPFTMGVIAVLLFLFVSGLYLDIARPL
jgi:membrane-associated protease RseP (regulator of RpoE activity)